MPLISNLLLSLTVKENFVLKVARRKSSQFFENMEYIYCNQDALLLLRGACCDSGGPACLHLCRSHCLVHL